MGRAVIMSEKRVMPYRANKTMVMLGMNCAAEAFYGNEEVRQHIMDIEEARPDQFTIEAASDIFMLGYIHGKRAERARKKGGREPIRKINKILDTITDTWILEQIYKFCVSMTAEE